MTPTDADLDVAASAVRARLERLLEGLPKDHPNYEPTTVNAKAQEAYRVRRGKGREALAPRGKGRSVGAILADHIAARFGRVS